MDLGANADGELLQRALDGEPVTDPGILELVAVLHAVQAVDQAGLAPRAAFVADLRARLLDDGSTTVLPLVPIPPGGPGAGDGDGGAAPSAATPTSVEHTPGPEGTDDTGAREQPGGPGSGDGGTVSVLRVAARPLRFLAAAAAAVLVIGGALGFASRSALPGDALYGVKQLLDRAAVQLAGSRFEEGLTYLAQAQEHIEDARELIDRGAPSPHDLDTALDSASDATSRAQTILMDAYRTEGRTEALTELADFYTRAIPQVDAMKPQVPAASLPAWQRLRDLLGQGQVATLRELATCAACGDRAAQARQVLARLTGTVGPTAPGSGATAPGTTPTTGAPPGATTSAPGLPLPTTTLPGGGLPLPGVSVTGGVTLPGGTVNLPSVGVTSSSVGIGGGGVTLPGATVSLPTVGVSSSVTVGGGGITLPGATVPLPSITLGAPSVSLLPSAPTTPLLP